MSLALVLRVNRGQGHEARFQALVCLSLVLFFLNEGSLEIFYQLLTLGCYPIIKFSEFLIFSYIHFYVNINVFIINIYTFTYIFYIFMYSFTYIVYIIYMYL